MHSSGWFKLKMKMKIQRDREGWELEKAQSYAVAVYMILFVHSWQLCLFYLLFNLIFQILVEIRLELVLSIHVLLKSGSLDLVLNYFYAFKWEMTVSYFAELSFCSKKQTWTQLFAYYL